MQKVLVKSNVSNNLLTGYKTDKTTIHTDIHGNETGIVFVIFDLETNTGAWIAENRIVEFLSKKELKTMIKKSNANKREVRNFLNKSIKYMDSYEIDLRIYSCEDDGIFTSDIILDIHDLESDEYQPIILESIEVSSDLYNDNYWSKYLDNTREILTPAKKQWIKWLNDSNYEIGLTEDYTI